MNNSLKRTESGWKYLEYSPAEIKKSTPDFLIFHGYGATAGDLVFLQSFYPEGRWFFPNAFLSEKGIPSWFDRDPEKYIQDLQNNRPSEEERFTQTNGDIGKLIEELSVQKENLILGGFSQGAFLSAFLALRYFTPKALILLSGGMAPEREISPTDISLSVPHSFFQSHGQFDEILPLASGKNLFRILSNKGWKGEFHPFAGGHEVPPEILQKLKDWILSVIKNKS